MEAARSAKAPRKSTFRTASLLKDLSIRSECVVLYGKFAGIDTHRRTSTIIPGGTLWGSQHRSISVRTMHSLLHEEDPSPCRAVTD